MSSGLLRKLFPFLEWFVGYTPAFLKRDLVSGVTVALVLIPQSMAYAQLAGLPAYYGLYASFLPPIIAALFGSSRQLATGPVAIVSLMTAAALEPIATAGSESFIAYAILLALLIGVFQLILGLCRLGLVVNFLSHPVISGFTNAAALIIATSQLSKLFGVTVDQADRHYETIYRVIDQALFYTHWPTLALAALAFAVMIGLRRLSPRLPNVLIAVLITTTISWLSGFENKTKVPLSRIKSEEVRQGVVTFNTAMSQLDLRAQRRVQLGRQLEQESHNSDADVHTIVDIERQIAHLNVDISQLKDAIHRHRTELRRYLLVQVNDTLENPGYYIRGEVLGDLPVRSSNLRILVSNEALDTTSVVLIAGGSVVGVIPQGLPSLSVPMFEVSVGLSLLPVAMIISLLGFMEAISIAKAMAAKTGQRLSANRELVGQGLANIAGSFAQSYAVSGSFSRSAVNIQAGAVSGLSSVMSSLVVVIVLLFLTPLLYYLPQSVLAAIIMMAVVGLLNLKSLVNAWRAQWHDGLIGFITFVCTLGFAPHLDRGIMVGVVLSLLFYLVRNMKPAMAMLSLHLDGTYRNRDRFDLKQCPYIAVIRYAGSLIFSNVDYLENQVLDSVESMPKLKHVIVVGNGINEIDASGVDALSTIVDRLHGQGLGLSLSGCNDNVVDILRRTGLVAKIGENNFYRNVERAINGTWAKVHANVTEDKCPLRIRPFPIYDIDTKYKKKLEAEKKAEEHKTTDLGERS